jgi:hypothetical protein
MGQFISLVGLVPGGTLAKNTAVGCSAAASAPFRKTSQVKKAPALFGVILPRYPFDAPEVKACRNAGADRWIRVT